MNIKCINYISQKVLFVIAFFILTNLVFVNRTHAQDIVEVKDINQLFKVVHKPALKIWKKKYWYRYRKYCNNRYKKLIKNFLEASSKEEYDLLLSADTIYIEIAENDYDESFFIYTSKCSITAITMYGVFNQNTFHFGKSELNNWQEVFYKRGVDFIRKLKESGITAFENIEDVNDYIEVNIYVFRLIRKKDSLFFMEHDYFNEDIIMDSKKIYYFIQSYLK